MVLYHYPTQAPYFENNQFQPQITSVAAPSALYLNPNLPPSYNQYTNEFQKF